MILRRKEGNWEEILKWEGVVDVESLGGVVVVVCGWSGEFFDGFLVVNGYWWFVFIFYCDVVLLVRGCYWRGRVVMIDG